MNNNTKNVQISKQKASKRSGRLYRVSGNLFVCKETSRAIPHNFVNTSRSTIHQFSAGAAVRMRRYLRECLAEYCNMVTLTYPGFFESDGSIVKEHLRRFLQELKRYVERHKLDELQHSVFWFLEFQERGAPHFHLFTTQYFPKDFVSACWYRIVNSEDPRHLAAGTRCEALQRGRSGTISYASKYAAKQCQKVVPDGYENVGRFWGVSGYRATMSADTFVSRSDRKSAHILTIENLITKTITDGIYGAGVEVYKKDEGVRVFILHEHVVMLKLRLLISRLAAQTMKCPQLFQDAELNIER